ncbi:MAG TPA: hypothetical protein DCR51_05255, partial [Idiomarina loihiensis]|nr:hypothetical protein [Idiomarina loihiensis]
MVKLNLLLCCFGVVALVGCASTTPVASDDQVADRAQKRLDALVEGDFAKAYSYATPGYRQSVSLSAHKPQFAGAGS